MNNKILISFLIPTRQRVALLKRAIESTYNMAKYPEKIECIIGMDSNDDETLNFVKTDEIFKKYKNIRVFSGPRIGYEYIGLILRELFKYSIGEILVGWADDCFVVKNHYDKIFILYKDKPIIIGHRCRMAVSRKAIKKYDFVKKFFNEKHVYRPDGVLFRQAWREGIYKTIESWYSHGGRRDNIYREGHQGKWKLGDLNIIDNYKMKEIKV